MAAGAIYEAHTPRRTSIFNILADFAIRPMLPRSTPHKKLKDDDDDRDSPSRQGSNSDRAMHSSDSDQETREDEEYGLADVDKERRRKRLARNKQLDSRVALNNMTDANRDDIATAAVTRNIVLNVLLLLSWYANSIGISVFNKWVVSADELDFHFPLFFTSFHMIVQFILTTAVLYFFPRFRPSAASSTAQYAKLAQDQDEQQPRPPASKQPIMSRMFYLTRIVPCAAATGLDIGLGNMSLKSISLTFYTMCKSSVLGFVLIFALIFRLESPSWKIALVISTMTVGVVMMVAGETAFDNTGFALIMSSAFFSGFRWSLTQILLLRNAATSNPFSSIFFLAPVMFVTLVAIAFPVEGITKFIAGFHALVELKGLGISLLVLLCPGLLAFLMTASEFALLKRTSVVTLSVCGIFKEVLMISTAAVVFHDELTKINVSGLVVTIGSIAAYNYMKFNRMRETARREAHEMQLNDEQRPGQPPDVALLSTSQSVVRSPSRSRPTSVIAASDTGSQDNERHLGVLHKRAEDHHD